ncbi:beta-3 adrenergic receptor [Biomphalaria pfeifferi]|uniref:Beta-3 adrenergic receptor n=1 Tax=Biomphalaria pfeifferi TaxID=112525 RepID=A0AAD8APR6_BIOPF|nr:beta-3 adrenergic receptor [Biomphalaria pfeifferi]
MWIDLQNASLCASTNCSTFSFDSHITKDLYIIVIISVVAFLIVVFTVFLGVAVIAALCCRAKGSDDEKRFTRKVIISMAVNDLLITLAESIPVIILLITNGNWTLGLYMFKSWLGYSTILSCVSACHIFSLALDKYLAICHPTKYRVLPDKIGYIVIILSWLVPTFVLLISISLPGQVVSDDDKDNDIEKLEIYILKLLFSVHMKLDFTLVFIPLLLSYVLYILVYIEIRKWCKRTTRPTQKNVKHHKSQSMRCLRKAVRAVGQKILLIINFTKSSSDLAGSSAVNPQRASTELRSNNSIRCRQNLKAIRTIASIVVSFTVCWFPCLIIYILSCQGYYITMAIFLTTSWFACLNSTLNLLLCIRVKIVRKSLNKLLCLLP